MDHLCSPFTFLGVDYKMEGYNCLEWSEMRTEAV